MIEDFEEKQLNGGTKLSTDERLIETHHLLDRIVNEFLGHLKTLLPPNPSYVTEGNQQQFDSSMEAFINECREIVTNALGKPVSYMKDFQIQRDYEGSLQKLSDMVAANIMTLINCEMYGSSRYAMSRSYKPTFESVAGKVLEAAHKWFLTPKDCSYLLENCYWTE